MILQRKLENGTRVIMEPIEGVRSVSLGFWVNAGSIYESGQNAGVSHFIEHMLFKGTPKRSAKQIAAEIDGVGGNINAFTAKECTCYYIKVLDEHLETAVDMLCDILLNSNLSEEELEREKGVVCEEIFMTEDSPEDLVFETGSSLFFVGTSLERPILGSSETVRAFTAQDLRDYMDKHYTAENIVIACAGSFDPERLFGLLSTHFAACKGSEKLTPVEHEQRNGFRTAFVQKDIEQVHTCLAFPAFALETDEHYALAILSNILGGSMSSRLFQTIREERGLAYSVYTYPLSYCRIGSLSAYAGSGEGQAVDVLRLMLEVLEDVIANGVSEEEFTRSKEQLKGNYLLGLESAGSKMNALGKSLLLQDQEYCPEKTLARIENVTIHDIIQIVPQVLAGDTFTCAAVGRVENHKAAMHELLENWWKNHGQTGTDICPAEQTGP
ncbi:MAG: insulinase family protein [Clostridiales bacterium]|nr:insulinase family protein [Clostridiales bacterium]